MRTALARRIATAGAAAALALGVVACETDDATDPGLEDDGFQDDGLEDDGLEDDGLEDDGLEDDGLDDGDDMTEDDTES